MKKELGIIGVGLMAGAAAYVLLNIIKETKDDTHTKPEKDYVDNLVDKSIPTMVVNNNNNDSAEFNNVKSSAISTISSRHQEASKIMKDAVETIYKRSEILEDESCELEQVSDELDKLLSEE